MSSVPWARRRSLQPERGYSEAVVSSQHAFSEETAMTTSRRSSGKSARERAAPDGTELLTLELQQIRSAESELSRVLPSLAQAVESEELRELLELREQQGKRILGELEAAFDEL